MAPEALWELGAEVIKIGVDPNGLNINKDCGSTAPEDLIRKVNEVRADIGIALDGDADRVVIVDEKGHIIDGDQLMAVIAEFWQKRGRLAGGGIVATVMSNLGLERYLESLDLGLARTPVGDRYVVEHMRQHGYNVGGEQSGHIVLSDFSTTGDGLVTALQLLSVVAQSGKPVSEICNRFEPLPQVLKNVRYKNGGAAARQCGGAAGDRQRQVEARQIGAARHPSVRHRARDSRDGRGRRREAGQDRGFRHRSRADRRGRLNAATRSALRLDPSGICTYLPRHEHAAEARAPPE